MEWKALANAIIHDGFEPGLRVTIIGCEKCGNPILRLLVSNQFPIFVSDLSRVTIYIYECPECGHREIDCIGTYGLPDFLPESVTPFTGHFFELWFELLRFSSKLKIDELNGNDSIERS